MRSTLLNSWPTGVPGETQEHRHAEGWGASLYAFLRHPTRSAVVTCRDDKEFADPDDDLRLGRGEFVVTRHR